MQRVLMLRAMIETLTTNLTDAEILDYSELAPRWTDGTSYKTGDRVVYDGIVYKVLQDHTAQADWTPEKAPSLFARVLIPSPDVIPDWEQPDSTNGYSKGDKVIYNGTVYESLIDNNVWSPEAYPAGWQAVI